MGRIIKKNILMLGPALNGLGGISRVVSLWEKSGFFIHNSIKYLPTVDDKCKNKLVFLVRSLFAFLLFLPNFYCVYIHTASANSFYRKSLFIILAVIFRKKILLHIHPSNFYFFILKLRKLPKLYVFFLFNYIDAFIVLVEDMHYKVCSWVPTKPVYVLHNPVDIQSMLCYDDQNRDPNRILFLGWFNRNKGVYDLIDAAEILFKDNIDFIIDCYGTKEVEELESYVLEKGLQSKVIVHGWADEQTKIKALCQSTVLVLPSHTEGIPNVILEAMAAKIPIISTLVGGLTEILRDGENAIIIQVKNPYDIAEKIRFAFENLSFCAELAEQAFFQASGEYDLPIIKAKFQQILSEVI